MMMCSSEFRPRWLEEGMPLTQRLLYAATFLCPSGVVVALVLNPELGAVLVIAGSVAGLLGLHRFGRLGPDPASGLATQHRD
jgi:hypothetical protein